MHKKAIIFCGCGQPLAFSCVKHMYTYKEQKSNKFILNTESRNQWSFS